MKLHTWVIRNDERNEYWRSPMQLPLIPSMLRWRQFLNGQKFRVVLTKL